MRWSEIIEGTGRITHEQAAELIAGDKDLWRSIVAYVQNFESGIAEDQIQREKFVSILSRLPKTSKNLFRGECRGEYWKDKFGRGFHSWSMSLKTAVWFQRDCGRGGLLLAIYKPVRALSLSDIITARMRLTDESHYSGQQAEVFVYDPDAVKVAFEIDEARGERMQSNHAILNLREAATEGSPADLLTDEFYEQMQQSGLNVYVEVSLTETNDNTVDLLSILARKKERVKGS